MTSYLFGRIGSVWHALQRHDPEYVTELRASVRLTMLARRRNPQAAPIRIPQVVDKRPGSGATLCGLVDQKLEALGVDPEMGDAMCAACEAKRQALG